jgi:hypothetical protein
MVGSDFEISPLEIEKPENYKGPLNYDQYRNVVEQYFRGQVGSQGSGIKITDGSNIRMYHNTFIKHSVAEIDIKSSDAGW